MSADKKPDINMEFLLNYCQDKPELFNRVATLLWRQFGLRSAEISLLCTYIASEAINAERD